MIETPSLVFLEESLGEITRCGVRPSLRGLGRSL